MSNTSTSSGGIGFCGLLTILFIGLKLGGVINWSWLWVLSPLWFTPALIVAVLAVAGATFGVAWIACAIYDWIKCRDRRKSAERRRRGEG